MPRIAFIFLCLFFAIAQSAAQTSPRTLVLAPLPIEKPELVKRLWKPFSDHPGKTAGATLRFALVASAEAKLAVRDIKGKKIAISQPLCTCCWFAGEVLLRAGIGSPPAQGNF